MRSNLKLSTLIVILGLIMVLLPTLGPMTTGQCDGYTSSYVTTTPTCYCKCSPTPSTGPLNTGTISGYVFYDTYKNGVIDDNPGIPDVTVSLIRGELIIETAVTDSNGYYEFTGLPAGTYKVIVTVPDGYIATTDDVVTIYLPTGGDKTVNFGLFYDYTGTGKIKGICYNANVGPSERLPNVDVFLYNSNGVKIRTDTTNHNGYFEFPYLKAGTYYVSVDYPDDLVDGSNYRKVVLAEGETAGLAFGIKLLLS